MGKLLTYELKDRYHTIISVDTEEVLEKYYTAFLIKVMEKLEMESFLQHTKDYMLHTYSQQHTKCYMQYTYSQQHTKGHMQQAYSQQQPNRNAQSIST